MSQFQYLKGGIACLLTGVLAGCQSRMVEVTIVNEGPALHVMEFDYPSASFGANLLASGATYHYKIKVQGPGPVSLQYEDAAGHTHNGTGPKVNLGDEGSLVVHVEQTGAITWSANAVHAK